MDKRVAAVFVVLAAAFAVAFYWGWPRDPGLQPVAVPSPSPSPEPTIRHPVAVSEEALPSLSESDALAAKTLGELLGADAMKLLVPEQLIRRFVVTVDSLSKPTTAAQATAFEPVAGAFKVSSAERIDTANYARYTRYVRLAEKVDAKTLAAGYVRLYPLFQSAYEELGTAGYFNDRLVEAIDDLLAAPEVANPEVAQPKVTWVFADPELERLSRGQKTMIRMGPENAKRVKAKLREIRAELTE